MEKHKPTVIGSSVLIAVIPVYGWISGGIILGSNSYIDLKNSYLALKSAYVFEHPGKFTAKRGERALVQRSVLV